jgi:hypothetical protein
MCEIWGRTNSTGTSLIWDPSARLRPCFPPLQTTLFDGEALASSFHVTQRHLLLLPVPVSSPPPPGAGAPRGAKKYTPPGPPAPGPPPPPPPPPPTARRNGCKRAAPPAPHGSFRQSRSRCPPPSSCTPTAPPRPPFAPDRLGVCRLDRRLVDVVTAACRIWFCRLAAILIRGPCRSPTGATKTAAG